MSNSGQINRIGQLIAAINENRNFEEISQIILGIEDVNQADQFGTTPLLIAASAGHTEIVAILLAAKGTNVNKANNYEATPLMMAAYNGHTATAKLLIDRGSKLNEARINDGATNL